MHLQPYDMKWPIQLTRVNIAQTILLTLEYLSLSRSVELLNIAHQAEENKVIIVSHPTLSPSHYLLLAPNSNCNKLVETKSFIQTLKQLKTNSLKIQNPKSHQKKNETSHQFI